MRDEEIICAVLLLGSVHVKTSVAYCTAVSSYSNI